MWRLLLPKQHKKISLWAPIVSCALIIHLIVFMSIFFLYRHDVYEIALTVSKLGAPVVFRSLPRRRTLEKGAQKNSNFLTKKNQPISKKAPMSLAQLASKKPTSIPKKNTKKKPLTKNKKIVTPQKKKQVAKLLPEKKEPEKKKDEPIKAVVPDSLPIKTVQAPSAIPSEVAQKGINQDLNELSLTIDADAQTMAAMEEFQLLQEEILHYWHPPAGIDNKRPCLVHATVGFDGKTSRIEIAESSGVLMYDIAARSAMHQIVLPRWTYGKRLVIAFA